MNQRFERQLPLIGDAGQRALSDSIVAIVGCGGLGSAVISNLVCAGVGHLILIDGDTVSESNLNRQFIHAGSVGESKVESARSWILRLCPECEVSIVSDHFSEDNPSVIDSADVVVDCLDNPGSRLTLADACIRKKKVLVHGAVDAYHGQVAVIRPEDVLRMQHIYPKPSVRIEHHSISPPVMLIGSIQANEVINILIGSDDCLRDEIVTVDLSDRSMNRYRITG